ncbi:hypothetical protein KL947_002408 [Ogataea haglerorum]|nr:hypothetical protein KL947_002408 [Ogataea haglerorum]
MMVIFGFIPPNPDPRNTLRTPQQNIGHTVLEAVCHHDVAEDVKTAFFEVVAEIDQLPARPRVVHEQQNLRTPVLDVVLAQFEQVLAHLVVNERLRHVSPLFWRRDVVDEQDERHQHDEDEGRRDTVDDEHRRSGRQRAHESGGCSEIAKAGPEVGGRAELQQETGHVGDDERHEESHRDERRDLVDVGKQKQLAQKPREQDAVDGVCAEDTQAGQDLVDRNGLEQLRGPHEADNDGEHGGRHLAENYQQRRQVDRLQDLHVFVQHFARDGAAHGEDDQQVAHKRDQQAAQRPEWDGFRRGLEVAAHGRSGKDACRSREKNAKHVSEILLARQLRPRGALREVREQVFCERGPGDARVENVVFFRIKRSHHERRQRHRQRGQNQQKTQQRAGLRNRLRANQRDHRAESQKHSAVDELEPVVRGQQFPHDAGLAVEIVQQRLDQAGHVQRSVQDLANVEDDAYRAAEFHPETAADHIIRPAALNGPVRRDGAHGERGEQINAVAHNQQQQRAQNAHLAQNETESQKHQYRQHVQDRRQRDAVHGVQFVGFFVRSRVRDRPVVGMAATGIKH